MRLSYTAGLLLVLANGTLAQDVQGRLGEALEELHFSRFDTAAVAFRQVLKSAPSLVIAQYDLGVCYFAQGQFEAARRAFNMTLKLAAGHRFATYYLGRIDLLEDRPREAIENFRSVSSGKPVADEFYYLGSAYFREGDIPESIRALKRALEVNPADHRAHFLLARVYRRAGDSATAEAEFRLSAKIRQEYQDKARDIERCRAGLVSLPGNQAIALCRQALDGVDPVKLVSLGALFAENGMFEAALPPLSRASRIDPDNFDAQFNFGLTYFQMKRYSLSSRSLRRPPYAPNRSRQRRFWGLLFSQPEMTMPHLSNSGMLTAFNPRIPRCPAFSSVSSEFSPSMPEPRAISGQPRALWSKHFY